jgi:hypothetical protein
MKHDQTALLLVSAEAARSRRRKDAVGRSLDRPPRRSHCRKENVGDEPRGLLRSNPLILPSLERKTARSARLDRSGTASEVLVRSRARSAGGGAAADPRRRRDLERCRARQRARHQRGVGRERVPPRLKYLYNRVENGCEGPVTMGLTTETVARRRWATPSRPCSCDRQTRCGYRQNRCPRNGPSTRGCGSNRGRSGPRW